MSFIINAKSSPRYNESIAQNSPAYQLQDAIAKNNPEIIEKSNDFLLGDCINAPLPNGELPLHFAIRQQSSKLIDLFFKNPQIDLNKKDDQGLTALDHLFLTNNQNLNSQVLSLFFQRTVEDVKHLSLSLPHDQINLIKKEIDERANDHSDLDDLHLAAQMGSLEELQQIASSGIDINQQTATGFTALHLAVKAGNEPVVHWLLEKGAKTDLLTNHRVSVLHLAALGDNRNIVKLLIEKGENPNISDDFGYTPLHYAALNENFTTTRCLIENGAHPLVDSHAISPLALMANRAQQRSHQRDPLKLGLLQTLMCICSIAVWIQSYYGKNTDLLATVLQCAFSTLSFSIAAHHLYNYMGSSKDSKAIIRSLAFLSLPFMFPYFDLLPVMGVASSVLRTFSVSQAIWQGMKASWRNRKLDPYRALKNILVLSSNAAFSFWNVTPRIQGIWNNCSFKKEDLTSFFTKKICEDPESFYCQVIKKFNFHF